MKPRILALAGLISLAAFSRLLPHPPNFAPLMAIALFGGVHFTDKKVAFLVPLIAMFLSDLLIGFHVTMPFVYLSFAAVVGLGLSARQNRSIGRIAGTALVGSLLFFIVTNFGVWASQTLYPKTIEGLLTCYVAAIPFFQQTLLGDALYTVTLFGGFTLAQSYLPALREQPLTVTR